MRKCQQESTCVNQFSMDWVTIMMHHLPSAQLALSRLYYRQPVTRVLCNWKKHTEQCIPVHSVLTAGMISLQSASLIKSSLTIHFQQHPAHHRLSFCHDACHVSLKYVSVGCACSCVAIWESTRWLLLISRQHEPLWHRYSLHTCEENRCWAGENERKKECRSVSESLFLNYCESEWKWLWMSYPEEKEVMGQVSRSSKNLYCSYWCVWVNVESHVQVTHIPQKQRQKFLWGPGRWECPMCLLTALWFPCHNTGNNKKASSQQIRGTAGDRESRSGRSGALAELER